MDYSTEYVHSLTGGFVKFLGVGRNVERRGARDQVLLSARCKVFHALRSLALTFGLFLATITIDFGEYIQLLTSVVAFFFFFQRNIASVCKNVTDIPGGILGHVVGFPDRRVDTSGFMDRVVWTLVMEFMCRMPAWPNINKNKAKIILATAPCQHSMAFQLSYH